MKHLLFLILLALIGCSGQTGPNGLTPMPSFDEPDDAALHEEMGRYIRNINAPINSQYDIARVDLNGDQRRDALVLMKLPHMYWCDWGGCPMLVFKAHNDKFQLVSRTENVRGPVFISQTRPNNWRKIVTRASGTNTEDRNVALTFNGISYPKNTFGAPTFDAEPHSRIMDKFFR